MTQLFKANSKERKRNKEAALRLCCWEIKNLFKFSIEPLIVGAGRDFGDDFCWPLIKFLGSAKIFS